VPVHKTKIPGVEVLILFIKGAMSFLKARIFTIVRENSNSKKKNHFIIIFHSGSLE